MAHRSRGVEPSCVPPTQSNFWVTLVDAYRGGVICIDECAGFVGGLALCGHLILQRCTDSCICRAAWVACWRQSWGGGTTLHYGHCCSCDTIMAVPNRLSLAEHSLVLIFSSEEVILACANCRPKRIDSKGGDGLPMRLTSRTRMPFEARRTQDLADQSTVRRYALYTVLH